ncbi:MAG TPA: alpha/beta hydrolase [Thermodesulfobacteriota bacterium]
MFEGFERTRIDTTGASIHVRHGGRGPALLLLHGYPQTHVMWAPVAARLAEHYTVICPDLRGYGDSSKPDGGDDHAAYSKRAMAGDMIEVMNALGHERFYLAGHDRGARVAHRLALDHEARVRRLAVLDIVPTHRMFRSTNEALARANFHWFFLLQPAPVPERMIGADPDFWLRTLLERWAAPGHRWDEAAVAEYLRCFRDPAAIHATTEDYRAAASIDLEHDEADLDRRIERPVLVLWGGKGRIGRLFDVLDTWRDRAVDVRGRAMPSGHFVVEEAPEETIDEFLRFFRD